MRQNEYLPGMEAEARNAALSQWYTDPSLADRVWHWANRYEQPVSVLEPAAGRGALLKPIHLKPYLCREVVAVEIDDSNCGHLQVLANQATLRAGHNWRVRHANFFDTYGDVIEPIFDLALMNPPYEQGMAEAWVLDCLRIARRVVGIFKAALLHGVDRHRMLWSRAATTREVRLASRPSFGEGAAGGDSGKTDFVVLEIVRRDIDPSYDRLVRVETWP